MRTSFLPFAFLAALAACADGDELPDAPTWADTAHGDSAAEPDCEPAQALDAAPLEPVAGELYYAQLGLAGLSLGEAALVVGPDGTRLLIDVGNDSHDDDVQDALAALGGGGVEHVLLTHYHADHADGVEDLLADVALSGRLIHRGFTHTEHANDNTIEKIRGALADLPGAELALCDASGCPGLDAGDLLVDGDAGPSWLPLGTARLEIAAADARIAGAAYEDAVGPFIGDDSNQENARSIVGVLAHGRFRMIFSGDLTGGGSDTTDVEGFIAPRLGEATDLDARGVDALQAGHHARDTSSSAAWVDALLPADGLDRNAVMGISTGHAGSPHAETLAALLDGGRLGDGYGWATERAPLGADHERLVDASGGQVRIRTDGGGDAYLVQAVDDRGEALRTVRYSSVRSCD